MAGIARDGGWGSQVLTGTAGDDTLRGDPPEDAPRLHVLDALRDPDAPALEGPAQSAWVLHAGALRLFGAGAAPGAGGVSGWTLTGEDRLAPAHSQLAIFYDPDDMRAGAPAVLTLQWEGASYLVTGGDGVTLSRLDAGGVPEPLETAPLDWTSGLHRPGAFAAWDEGGVLHILVGGGWDGGLTVMRWDAFGLRAVARVEERAGLPLAGVSDLALAEIGGRRFAVSASPTDNGIGVWELGPGAPVLRDWRGPGDGESGTDLSRARAVEAVARSDGTWVFAAAEWGRLIAYRLDGAGRLTRSASLAGGATDLAAVRIEGRDFLAVVRGGRAVEVFEIDPAGRLTPHLTLDLGAGARAERVAAVADGARVLLSLARADAEGWDLLELGLDGADELRGGAGDDLLEGGGGPDRLFGEAGNDTLRGGDGDDVLSGGDGADRLEGGAGRDSLDGGRDADLLRGEAGNDTLDGGAGDDTLQGGRGDDLLRGGPGNDRLEGGPGRDTLRGGPGADDLRGGPGGDLLDGGGGPDRLRGENGDDRLRGGPGEDWLQGGPGRDTLEGGGAHDRLEGAAGDDRLWGGTGNDTLDGGAGDDRLQGGPGHDRLTGGPGADLFVFGPADGRDRVTDFEPGTDRLRFVGLSDPAEIEVTGRGGEAVLVFGETVVTLEGIAPEAVSADWFALG
mgnify:CR=1 FL=1